jgi:thiamine biosynthesis lipoprotein
MHSTKLPTKPKGSPVARSQFAFEAIGTQWYVSIFQPISLRQKTELQQTVQKRIATFDKSYSRFRDDSWVADVARQAGTYKLPSDAQPLFDLYKELYEITDGLVTPLVGQLLADAGYNASYSLQASTLQTPPRWEEALQYDFPTLTVRKPVLLDVGAAGKGYIVDIICELLRQNGLQQFCVDAGGDMYYSYPNERMLRVGLEHPADPTQAIGIANLPPGQALCGSAGNRRAWGEFHHIMHPTELRSPRHISAVWTVAKTCMLADALSTCLFFVSPMQLATQYTFEYAIVHQDNSLTYSAGFPATFFS